MPNNSQVKFRRGTSYNVSFPNLPTLDFQPGRVDLLQSQYSHDVLKLYYNTTSGYWFNLLNTGEPIKFEWSRGGVKGEWFGYVYFVSKQVDATRWQEMEIHCIGATFPLKAQVTRIFENKSISEVASIIAKENGFNFIGKDDGRKFPQLIITGQSYWEWLSQHAKKIGYGLVVDGISIIFGPIDNIIDQSMNDIPILSMTDPDLPTGAQWLDRTLDVFKILNGEYIEEDFSRRTTKFVGGIDPYTGDVITMSSSPKTVGTNLREFVSDVLFNEQQTEQVINDLISAQSASDGAAHLARFNMPAKIKAQGDSRLRPFAPVYIEGTGDVTDGYWMIKEILHKFALVGDYQIEASLATDGLGKNNVSVYRPENVSRSGTIPLNSLGNLGVYTPNASGGVPVTLDNRIIPIGQLNRGYLRTPSRWIVAGN